jgi:hypothetical protein
VVFRETGFAKRLVHSAEFGPQILDALGVFVVEERADDDVQAHGRRVPTPGLP